MSDRSEDSIQEQLSCLVSCPPGCHYILEKELHELGCENTKAMPSVVSVSASLSQIYRILIGSRIANRVLLVLSESKVASTDDLYKAAAKVKWPSLFSVDSTFSVNFVGRTEFVRNTAFGALTIKDAIVDVFRQVGGERPSVDKSSADISIDARLFKGVLTLCLDLSGESLHKRGYRDTTGAAPLKENVAAAILKLAGWPNNFPDDASLVDPMCGSGTFLIEGAMMARSIPPNLRRETWGFDAWSGHNSELWEAELIRAEKAILEHSKQKIIGFDASSKVIKKAWANLAAAGLNDKVHVEKRSLDSHPFIGGQGSGLVVSNPPYGERLNEKSELPELYQQMGKLLASNYEGYVAAMFVGDKALGPHFGWRSHKQYQLKNGALDSSLLLFDLHEKNKHKTTYLEPSDILRNPDAWVVSDEARAAMFTGRLRKNRKNIGKWAKRNKISCYRLYDADIPEYAVALDLYEDSSNEVWAHVQEYQAPKTVDQKLALERLLEVLCVVQEVLDLPSERISLKSRSAKKGRSQYEKVNSEQRFLEVSEGERALRVNLYDYLDTGLFLDHRPVRDWIAQNAQGKRFLNLFCYTGAATIAAAVGGAKTSLSLDMSKPYIFWARENARLNRLKREAHEFEFADCVEWLEQEVEDSYDLIFLDPPSFSNSKKMEGVLDIQRDHEQLIKRCMQRLSANGTLIFSNNLRSFKLSETVKSKYDVEDRTEWSIPDDFSRNKKIHQCFFIRAKKR